jgi:CelD/BcsL family acetyltransferase involved in cellulose biosynthesis
MKNLTMEPAKMEAADAAQSGLTIKVYNNIDDPELVTAWKQIVQKYDYFPQSSYGWCAAWWKRLAGKLELHVAAVCDETDYIIGIAPLCIEARMGMRSLRSFPIHFGDFYTLIIERDDRYEAAFECLIEHVLSFLRWDVVRLHQVNSDDVLCKLLASRGFSSKKITEVTVADFEGKSFDEYLQSLSGNRRKDLTKKARRLERDHHNVELVKIRDYSGYLSYFAEMKELYDLRWSNDVLVLTDQYYECRQEAVRSCFNEGRMLLYILKANNLVIAYHLGFSDGHTFYTWKESHNPAYAYYSPGALIRFHFFRDLIQSGFSQVNFMAGDYDFKRTLAKGGRTTTNFLFVSCNHSLRGWLLGKYYLHWRDIVKMLYEKMFSYPLFRRIVTKKVGKE